MPAMLVRRVISKNDIYDSVDGGVTGLLRDSCKGVTDTIGLHIHGVVASFATRGALSVQQ